MPQHIKDSAKTVVPQEPVPQYGDGATVFGGGAVLTPAAQKAMGENDPAIIELA